MKKIVITLLVSFLGICSIQAQGKPSFGLKAGLNFADLDSDDIDADNSTGFHAGVVLHVPLVKKWGLQPEVLYSVEGNDLLEVGYINVPVLLTYKLVPGLRAHLGPQFKIKANTDFGNDQLENAIEDDIEGFNFDGAVGLEYKFPVIGIFAQARYTFGLTDVIEDADSKINVFQLSVGYRF